MKPAKSVLRESDELRKHPRKGCGAVVHFQEAGKRYMGYATDVSQGGMRLESRRGLRVGEHVILSFRLFNKRDGDLDVQGKVVWARQKENGFWQMGMQFVGLDPKTQKDIAFYVLN